MSDAERRRKRARNKRLKVILLLVLLGLLGFLLPYLWTWLMAAWRGDALAL